MKNDSFTRISYRSPVKITRHYLFRYLSWAAKTFAKGNLVDLGCGIKPYEKIFSKYIESYYGVDFQPTANSSYKELTRADLFADCSDTRLEKESFDTVLSTQVMEHVVSAKEFLDECFRLLKKDGIGIFTVPFVWQLHSEPYDYFRFTKYAIEKLFRAAGFEIVELKNCEGAYATIMQTKIISIYTRPVSRKSFSLINYFVNLFRIPILNFMAIKLDNLFYNDKLCLNYLVIVKKAI